MRLAAFALLIASLGTNAVAQADSPLPPGKPAGVHQAALQQTENAILIGMIIVGIGVSALLVAKAREPSSSATATSP